MPDPSRAGTVSRLLSGSTPRSKIRSGRSGGRDSGVGQPGPGARGRVLRLAGCVPVFCSLVAALFCISRWCCCIPPTAIVQNKEGKMVGLYVHRKCSATNRIITAKVHASVQFNIGHLDENGLYDGHFTTFALSGFVRAQGDADSSLTMNEALLLKWVWRIPNSDEDDICCQLLKKKYLKEGNIQRSSEASGQGRNGARSGGNEGAGPSLSPI
ncbi:unnamed protein product [Urochloa humidicola]